MTQNREDKENLIDLMKKAIEVLCEKNISEVVILSSYKISSVLSDNYGINVRVDKIGRLLAKVAKRNELKRLKTNIPKYKLKISQLPQLKFHS